MIYQLKTLVLMLVFCTGFSVWSQEAPAAKTGLSGEAVWQDEKTTILVINREMEEAFLAKEYETVASYYSDDAVMIGAGHEVKGREAIDQYWIGLKDKGMSWELENVDLQVYEEVAIQRGISRLRFLHEEKEHLSEVRFTLVWVKEDGQWKIEIDHYSPL